jgi:RNA polymerase sigma-70 factor, ECF subfamily
MATPDSHRDSSDTAELLRRAGEGDGAVLDELFGRHRERHGEAMPQATSEALAAQLLGKVSTPSQVVGRAKLRARVQEAMNALADGEREILALRHFEQLSNAEAALELGIQEAAASKRYMRALIRLRGILAGMRITPSSPEI